MNNNIGSVDKTIRIVVGVGLLSLIFLLPGNARWWGLLGLGPLITAFIGWCPGYVPFGISTRKTRK